MPERLKKLHQWLEQACELQNFTLTPASGDASFRRYFRIAMSDGSTLIAMDAPPEKESCTAFVDIARHWGELGLNVPAIHAEDHALGFLLLDDLGGTENLYLQQLNENNVDDHYQAALNALVALQTRCDPQGLPAYNRSLLLNEMELFRDWLLQKHMGVKLSETENSQLDHIFDVLAQSALQQPTVCVHRDYHSRNLLIAQPGNDSPGIIDFQDAVAGPLTYDLVSLIKDCYIKWPRQQVLDWARGYAQQCLQAGLLSSEQQADFIRWFDLMGVQRHLKASGIFARLNIRDGKNGYLKDIPRTLSYITDLKGEYPELEALVALIEKHF